MKNQNTDHIYIHIPFCSSKCPFCAFKTGVRHRSTISDYVHQLCKEIEGRLSERDKLNIETVYMGGGTSNLLQLEEIEKIMNSLFHHNASLKMLKEITIELHPNLISEDYIKGLIQLRFNRFSVGVQSFQEDELKVLRRGYTAQEVQKKISLLKETGIQNLNFDFMMAIPGQTLQSLQQNISIAQQFDPQHLSCYFLTLEEGTQFMREHEKGQFLEMNEETSSLFYEHLCAMLEKTNFLHYEISNWAKRGYECLHHLRFWEGKPYLGFGLSATSFDNDQYTLNTSSLKNYLSNPFLKEEILTFSTEETKKRDQIIRQSRTLQGIESTWFTPDQIKPLLEAKLLIKRKNQIRLTPKGWMLNDYVVGQLLEAI
ncbi:MAG: radical SAM family heme chaperone HemW [Chlamydiae bacterium]|nr:radical SAM family heme chaperone HemW [Chlamydiota bacterium]MBI3276297.1 radical SAM family heme chaperone HemW [Chlamydiota bacterium]